MSFYNFYYDRQIKRYVTQFMALFDGLQVETGKNDGNDGSSLIRVPIVYGSKDRVAAWIAADGSQNKPLRLPALAAYASGIEVARERAKGIDTERINTYLKRGGVIPNDIRVTKQLMPIPYNVTMDLYVYTSNQEQHFQILEQILMLFNPDVYIQTSDALFDWTKITTVELQGITPSENFPQATDRRMINTTLTFLMPIYIAAPAQLRDDYISSVKVRLGIVGRDAVTSDEVIGDLDGQGLTYDTLIDLDGIELDLTEDS